MTSHARTVGVVPARMGSTRFPGKPLALIHGRTMIEHVYRRACDSQLDHVVIATCDEEIRAAAEGFGAPVVMTSSDHERACERMAEAAASLPGDIFVLVQGDEPLIAPSMIDEAVTALDADEAAVCATLVGRIDSVEEIESANTVKVVMDRKSRILYMTRAPIPTSAPLNIEAFKQIAIIPFRRAALLEYAELPETPLEMAESVDLLRLIEHGLPVLGVPTEGSVHAVDVPGDVATVEALMAQEVAE